jgi:hypothetical protein
VGLANEDWRACTDPVRVLRGLRNRVSPRKLRLFACACARQFWPLLQDARSRNAVETAEQYAEGKVDLRQLQHVRAAALEATHQLRGGWVVFTANRKEGAVWWAAMMAWAATGENSRIVAWDAVRSGDRKLQLQLLHCLFGSPLFAVSFERSWRTSPVVAIARAVDADADFTLLPILGDALEDAGCTNADILGHCRSATFHARGCWIVDWVLDRS